MNSSDYHVRRATLDDIGQLTALWNAMNFPAAELAKRPTEFQVTEGADGNLVGLVGLQIAERQGRIHSEAFKEFALFKESEKQRTQRAFQHARILKMIATFIALALLVLVAAGAFYVVRKLVRR